MKRIRSKNKYDESFPSDGTTQPGSLRDNALKCALDIRKFEIDLYWKRATYFWTLLAVAFGGFFAVKSGPTDGYALIIACIGLVLSIAWYLVNRGSKYWQTNWERHVDALEDEIQGPLYKTTISKDEFPLFDLSGGYPFSVSRINQIVSLYVVVIWIGLVLVSVPTDFLSSCITRNSHWILLFVTAVFLLALFWSGRSGAEGKVRNINFVKAALDRDDDE